MLDVEERERWSGVIVAVAVDVDGGDRVEVVLSVQGHVALELQLLVVTTCVVVVAYRAILCAGRRLPDSVGSASLSRYGREGGLLKPGLMVVMMLMRSR